MSDYRRGKQEVAAWASYWLNWHKILNSGSSVEGRMAEYGHVIRSAFNPNESHFVDEAMSITPWYIRRTHEIVMSHPNRELCIAWYFADEDILKKDFPEIDKGVEPSALKALYKKVGRKFGRA